MLVIFFTLLVLWMLVGGISATILVLAVSKETFYESVEKVANGDPLVLFIAVLVLGCILGPILPIAFIRELYREFKKREVKK